MLTTTITSKDEMTRVVRHGMRLVQTLMMSWSYSYLRTIDVRDMLKNEDARLDLRKVVGTLGELIALGAYSPDISYGVRVFRIAKQFLPLAIIQADALQIDIMCRLSLLLDVIDRAFAIYREGEDGILEVPMWLYRAVEANHLGVFLSVGDDDLVSTRNRFD